MVSRSFVRAFRNIFRKSLDSNEGSENGDISSDVSLTGCTDTNELQQHEKGERIECDLSTSYFSNVQPRTSIIKKNENFEKNEVGIQNEMTGKNILEKTETSEQYNCTEKTLENEKMNSVSTASTAQECSTGENEDSGSSLIPDSQSTEKTSPTKSTPLRKIVLVESETSSESECSFNSSPKGIYDLCESQPKFIDQKNAKDAKEGGNVNGRVHTRAPAKRGASKSRFSKKESVDEELGTVILNKRVTPKKKKVVNESKACKSRRRESAQKTDMVIRLRLPISGSNRKKLFAVKLSRLISLVSNKRHPLNKWAGKLSMENVNLLNDNEFKVLLKILSHFVCVKIVRR